MQRAEEEALDAAYDLTFEKIFVVARDYVDEKLVGKQYSERCCQEFIVKEQPGFSTSVF